MSLWSGVRVTNLCGFFGLASFWGPLLSGAHSVDDTCLALPFFVGEHTVTTNIVPVLVRHSEFQPRHLVGGSHKLAVSRPSVRVPLFASCLLDARQTQSCSKDHLNQALIIHQRGIYEVPYRSSRGSMASATWSMCDASSCYVFLKMIGITKWK